MTKMKKKEDEQQAYQQIDQEKVQSKSRYNGR